MERYGDLMDAANTKAEAAKAELASFGGTGTRPTTTRTTTRTTTTPSKNDEKALSGSL